MKTRKILNLGLIAMLLVGTMVISGCIEDIKGPSPIVQSSDCNEEFQGFNAVIASNVLVTNDGDAGEVIVEAEFISKSGSTYSDTKTVYMNAGESRYVNFVFDTSWNEGGSCIASARAK